MKTNLLKLTCTLVAAMACVSVNAQASGSCGANATWEYDNGTLTISGTGAMADYTDALTDNPWNDYRNSITKVVIGDDITHIGNWAFMGCSALYEVTIGDHVASIGAEAFANCLNEDFKYLAIPASVENIGAFALSNIKYLEYIACYASTAPTLGAEALTILNNLVAIYVPTAKVANYQAATGWSDLSAKITYPHGNCGDGEPATDAVTWAFDMASGTMTLTGTGAVKTFSDQNPMAYPWNSEDATVWNPSGMDGNAWGWMGITSLVIGEGITNLPDYSFGMYIHLTSVTLPSTLTSVGASSLEECAFTSITLPEGLETIGDYAFLSSKFSSITLPSTLTKIGGSSFNDCKSLTSITIPANVTSIGESAFQNCIALETVTMLRATPPTLGDLAFYDYSNPEIIIPALTAINVPAANVEDYKAAAGWSDYAALIVAGGAPAATTTTFSYTASEKLTIFDDISNFIGATAVKSHEFAGGTGTVVYEGTVTSIADYTFRYDDTAKNKMTGIVLPSSLTSTGDYTFWYCEQLASVSFEGTPTLTTIGKSAFSRCTSLSSFAVPASVESIGVGAFKDCSSLTTVTFVSPSSVTTINQSAFSDCTMLTSISLPESLTTLGSVQTDPQLYYNGSVFWNSGITSIVIPKNVTTIYGSGYFADCNMTSVTVDAENPKYADLGCNGIFEKATNKLVVGCNITTIPNGITTIGYESFWAVTAPFDLVLPESVTTIEGRAFHLTNGLRSINIPSGITFIDEENFICSNLTDVYCYASSDINWEGGMKWAFAYPKSTIFHVADAAEWETKFPEANAFFVSDLVDFTLAEDAENTGAIGSRNGHEVNATLTRTLKAGSWNTFAAPFDIDAATMTAKGITAKELTASSLTSGTLTLTFADASAIEAGKPYLVKVAADIVNPSFEHVTIESALTPSEMGNVVFVPTTGKTLVTGPTGHENDESSVLFLANGNKLQYPLVVNTPAEASSYLKGFRAYFQLKDGAAARDFRLDLGEGELTGIADTTLLINNESIMNNNIYNLSGQKINGKLSKGLYIVNGRKVVVK